MIQPGGSPRPGVGAHIAALDGLRGIAVLLVIAMHWCGSMSVLGLDMVNRLPFRLGWAGVDVFFALSGFLITGILLDTKDRPGFFRNFYARRFLRICPLYYTTILVVFLARTAIGPDPIWGDATALLSPGSLLWPMTYLENVATNLQGSNQTGILTHYWSLAVEEHFYLVWPILVWACKPRVLAYLACGAVAFTVVSRAGALVVGADPAWIFGFTPLRLDGLALGALAALATRSYVSKHIMVRAGAALTIASLAAAVLIVALRHTLSQFDPVMWVLGSTLIATAAAGLIVVVASGRAVSLLIHPLLRWFGRYSFGLYVWHPIVAVILLHSHIAIVRPGEAPIRVMLAMAFTAAVTLVVAWVSFHGFEKHFLALKRFFSSSEKAALDRPAPAGTCQSEPVVR